MEKDLNISNELFNDPNPSKENDYDELKQNHLLKSKKTSNSFNISFIQTIAPLITLNTLNKLPDTLGDCFTLSFSNSDTYLAGGYSSGLINIYNINSLSQSSNDTTQLKPLRSIKASEYPITSIKFKGDSHLISASADGKLSTFHSSSGKILHSFTEESPIQTIDINADATLFATGGKDKVVRLYDDQTKTLIRELKANYDNIGHSNRIFSICFHKTNMNIMCSGGWDSIVVFYDLRTKTISGNCLGAHISGDAIDLKDNLLLAGCYNTKEQVKIYDIRMNKLLETVAWEYNSSDHTSLLYAARFRHNGTKNLYSVGGSNIDQFRIFENDSKDYCFEEIDNSVYALEFSRGTISKKDIVAYGCKGGNIMLYEIKER